MRGVLDGNGAAQGVLRGDDVGRDAREGARMALAMAKHGSLLYRQVFVVSAARRGSWQRLVQFASASAANASSARGVTQ